MTNKKIAKALKLAAQLGDLHDENPFKTKALASAAFHIERMEEELTNFDPNELESKAGLGKSTTAKVKQLLEKQSFDDLEKWIALTPLGVMQMLQIKGIGAKKVRALWTELGIESIGELLYACNENRLVSLKGFGSKTQDQIIQSIGFMEENAGKFHFAEAEQAYFLFQELIQQKDWKGSLYLVGEMRRKLEVVECIEIIIQGDFDVFINQINDIAEIHSLEISEQYCDAFLLNKYKFRFYAKNESDYANQVLELTGPEQFVKQNIFKDAPKFRQEEALFKTLGLPYIIPELRDLPLDDVKKIEVDKLIQTSQLRGILHCHSKYSDGANTLKEMADACKALGYQYFGICDHSQSAQYAGGLKPERVLAQHQEIEQLNKSYANFVVLKGIESDILNDGSLDYDDDFLKQFDFVVASVHSNLKMTEERAMQRILKAIEHPATNILGHPSGRLLLSRNAYPLDYKKLIDACAANKVAIELNAHPYRLDIDWRWIPYCLEKGVFIAINPDAHEIRGFEDVQYGVNVARKGGLYSNSTLNCMNLEEIRDFFKK